MSSLDYLAIALGALSFAFVVFVLVPKALLFGLRDSMRKRIARRYPEASELTRVEYRASSFGMNEASLGAWLGDGALVVTAKELCFFQTLPPRELTLQLTRITGLSIVRSRLGKPTTSSLLRIDFSSERPPGSIAFWVPDPSALMATLEAQAGIGRRPPSPIATG